MPSRKRIKMYKAKIKKRSEMSLMPKGSFRKTRAQHACMPLDVAHEWPHTLGSSIDDDLLGMVTALFWSA